MNTNPFSNSEVPEIKNAKISRTMLGVQDHGIMTCSLYLDYGGAGQSFGGFAFDSFNKELNKRVGSAFGINFIMEILKVADVKTWEELPGKFLRVEATYCKTLRIGHITKELWFTPEDLK